MLEVDIQKSIGPFRLDICFEHRDGILILFGRSGAGKTTALRIIAGISRPTSGNIRFAGRTLYAHQPRTNVSIRRRRIGYIFQQHNLFPHMTARQNIEYAAKDPAGIDRWLDAFHVRHIVNRFPSQMSGGEQQRIAIIRALMTHPELLLLDEPMSAVDVATRAVMLNELRDVQRQSNIPMIYVTHNVSEAFRLGDRVLVLDAGQIIHDGVPIEVFHTPTSIPLAGLSGTENVLQGRVTAHHADDNTSEFRIGDVTLHVPLCRETVGENTSIAIRPEDILIALHEMPDTSARNQLRGRITEVQHDTLPSVLVELPGGPTLRAHITRRSIESLKLDKGVEVYLLIKAWACHPIDAEAAS